MQRAVGGDRRQQQRRNLASGRQILHEQITQPAYLAHLLIALREDVFVDEALHRERAMQFHNIVFDVSGFGKACGGNPQQSCAQMGQEDFKRGTEQQHQFQRASQEQVERDCRQIRRGRYTRCIGGLWATFADLREVCDDRRILQNEPFDILFAHTESDRRPEMRGRFVALTQCLIGGRDIVVAGRVEFVRRNGLGEHFERDLLATLALRNDAQEIQAGDVRRLTRKNLAADVLRLREASVLMMPARLGQELR